MARCLLIGILCAQIVGSSCLFPQEPDHVTAALAYFLYLGETGNCLAGIRNGSYDSRLYFCGRVPGKSCNLYALTFGDPEYSLVAQQVQTLGNQIPVCAADANSLWSTIYLNGPYSSILFGKYGAWPGTYSSGFARFRRIDSCESVGMTAGPFVTGTYERLLDQDEVQLYRKATLLLHRYAASQLCKDSIPLTPGERTQNADLAAGKRPDFSICDAANFSDDDPRYPNCPPSVVF